MTNATSGVSLGGSGYGYGDYVSPASKKPPAPYDDEQGRKKSRILKPKKGFLDDDEIEVFLFTIRDPVKTVISKLMDLISEYGPEIIPDININLAETGPLGYTTMGAFRPMENKPVEKILKPVVK